MIPARNAEHTLAHQLGALSHQAYEGTWELLVVDNGSTDATTSVAASFQDVIPQLRVLSANEREGVNHARNVGIRRATGEYILLCDADDQVQDGWLHKMVYALLEHDAVAGSLDLAVLNDASVSKQRRLGKGKGSLDFLPYAVGANCGFRRTVWEAIDGFDESLSGGADEVDFFWRMQLAGFRLAEAPDAIVNYRLPDSLRDDMRRGFLKGRASAVLYVRFAEHGATFDARAALRDWAGLFFRSYRLLGPRWVRRGWLVRAAQQTGKAVGGISLRRLYL